MPVVGVKKVGHEGKKGKANKWDPSHTVAFVKIVNSVGGMMRGNKDGGFLPAMDEQKTVFFHL